MLKLTPKRQMLILGCSMVLVLSILSLGVIVELFVYFKLKNGSGDINREVVAAIIYDVIVMMIMLVAFLGVCASAVFRNRKHLKI